MMMASEKESAGMWGGRLRKRCERGLLAPLQVCKDPALDTWKLYLVDWGYNTAKERQRAAANPRIQLLDVAQFADLLTGARAT